MSKLSRILVVTEKKKLKCKNVCVVADKLFLGCLLVLNKLSESCITKTKPKSNGDHFRKRCWLL